MRAKRSPIRLGKDEYKALCRMVFARDNRKCRVCRLRKPLHCHHIIYRSQGGDDIIQNLLSVCNDCHEAIHHRFVVVLPHEDGAAIDANQRIRFMFLENWKPKTRVTQ